MSRDRRPFISPFYGRNKRLKDQYALLTDTEAADRLGVCPRTVWTLADTGQLPRVKFGRSVRYDPKDIAAFIEWRKQRGRHASTNGGVAA